MYPFCNAYYFYEHIQVNDSIDFIFVSCSLLKLNLSCCLIIEPDENEDNQKELQCCGYLRFMGFRRICEKEKDSELWVESSNNQL